MFKLINVKMKPNKTIEHMENIIYNNMYRMILTGFNMSKDKLNIQSLLEGNICSMVKRMKAKFTKEAPNDMFLLLYIFGNGGVSPFQIVCFLFRNKLKK